MEDVVLELKPREVTGKTVKHLRRDGIVPAVIHDHGKDSVIVMGPYLEVQKAYQEAGKHHPVKLKVGTKHYTAIIKNVDIGPKKHEIRHIVFNAVNANEKVTTSIPIKTRFDEGNEVTPAERNGLIVLHHIDSIEVEALATNLPDFVEIDGEKLVEIGDHVTVGDLIIPEGVEVKTDAAQTIATVFEPSALQAANDAAGGTAEEEAPAEEETEGEEGGSPAAESGSEEPKQEEQKEAE